MVVPVDFVDFILSLFLYLKIISYYALYTVARPTFDFCSCFLNNSRLCGPILLIVERRMLRVPSKALSVCKSVRNTKVLEIGLLLVKQ